MAKTSITFVLKDPRRMGVLYAGVAKHMPRAVQRELSVLGRESVTQLKANSQMENIRDLGAYQRGWRYDRLPIYLAIRLRNAAPHAIFVEMGRRAGARMPPPRALEPWVRRHIKIILTKSKRTQYSATQRRANAIRSIAFLIARAIGKRGIKARPILWSAWMQKILKHRLRFAMIKALDTAVSAAADAAKK